MKISENWLRTWVNPNISTDELVTTLTMAGLEVDGIEVMGAELAGILVGKIIKAEQHPEADKLQVCTVDVGAEETLQIICGAPNAREGIKVAVATIGCILPGDFKIKKAKLRGITIRTISSYSTWICPHSMAPRRWPSCEARAIRVWLRPSPPNRIPQCVSACSRPASTAT